MFSDLILRNSKRSRKENGLFFSSLVISIVAFYLILSLSKQDVMIFLQKMESDAVNKLLILVPVFYVLTLGILFFLIYFACKYQLQRRRHEFGVYLMMGMSRGKLFSLLMAEDLISSLLALVIGIPVAVLLSELISLVTVKAVGLGIIGHQFSFSLSALGYTVLGFLAIKLIAFSILSTKICRQEVGSLLGDEPFGAKKQKPRWVYILVLILGIAMLTGAYSLAIGGRAWMKPQWMFITLGLGFFGTILLFYGMRILIQMFSKMGTGKLHVFNFRQIEENVIRQSTTLAISSLLILAALCCFGAGVGIAGTNAQSDDHVLDVTFDDRSDSAIDGALSPDELISSVQQLLKEQNLESRFSVLAPMRLGHIRTTDDFDHAFQMDSVMEAIERLPASRTRDVLLNNLSFATFPRLICLSDYNGLLELAGKPTLDLAENEAGVYISSDFTDAERTEILNQIFSARPEAQLDGTPIFLTGDLQTTNLVTDRSITLSFALILPDDAFFHHTAGDYDAYINGVLDEDFVQEMGLMNAISEINNQLDRADLNNRKISYESYLQNMGRSLFYMVAASYITIYLAIIFMVVANTILGVQFLMSQRKSGRRYQTLVRLGADYSVLRKSGRSQVQWFMGLPVAVAALSSLLGVKAIVGGALAGRVGESPNTILLVSAAMILLLLVVEYIYITVVKRSSDRYLLTLMQPQREE